VTWVGRIVGAPRSVKAIGWGCVAFGALILGSAGMTALAWAVLPEALGDLGPSLGPQPPFMRWILEHLGRTLSSRLRWAALTSSSASVS